MTAVLSSCGSAQTPSGTPTSASAGATSFAQSDLSDVSASESQAETPASGTLACIGDSITFGMGTANPSTDAWPALLQDKLGSSWAVTNLGVSGTTLLDEGHFPYRSTGNVERAKELDPTLAIIMLGTNDTADPTWSEQAYRTQLSALVDELAQANSHDLQFVLMAPPCTFYGSEGEPKHDGINDRIGGSVRSIVKELAAQKGARYVDLFAFTEDHPEWFPDHLHPNEAGNAAIADYVYEQVFS